MKLPVFIPSYRRACQLHLLVESLRRHAPEMFIFHVLYKADTLDEEKSYRILQGRFPEVFLVREEGFKDGFQNFLEKNNGRPVGLFTDDCVAFRSFDCSAEDISEAINMGAWSVSFRLGRNTTVQNYLDGQRQPPLDSFPVRENGRFLWFPYKKYYPFHNFGYFLAWDSHFYSARDLYQLGNMITYKNPREFEGKLAGDMSLRMRLPHEYMCCPKDGSCVIVNTVNQVQGGGPEAGVTFGVSPQELTDRYTSGEIIDLDSMDFSRVEASHGEIPFMYKAY